MGSSEDVALPGLFAVRPNPDISHCVPRAADLTPNIDCDGGCGVAGSILDDVLAQCESGWPTSHGMRVAAGAPKAMPVIIVSIIIISGDVGETGSAQPVSRRKARWAVAKTAL